MAQKGRYKGRRSGRGTRSEVGSNQAQTLDHHRHKDPPPPSVGSSPTKSASEAAGNVSSPPRRHPQPPANNQQRAKSSEQHVENLPSSPPTSTSNKIPTAQKTNRSPWDPLARYYSDASSFPDYGAPEGKMGLGNVKSFNQVRKPVNVLSSSPSAAPRTQHITPSVELPNKRQRTERQSEPQDLSVRYSVCKTPRKKSLAAIIDAYADDPYELRSTSPSTTSHQASNYKSTVPEFRSVLAGGKSNSARVRKSRTKMLSQGVNGTKASADHSPTPDSPDVLTIEDKSPPPAAIMSDIGYSRGAKRTCEPSLPEFSAKRSKPSAALNEIIDVSEDELQTTSRTGMTRGGRRKTNFSGLHTKSQEHVQSRGDIQPTDFGLPKNPKASQSRSGPLVSVTEAASGSNVWKGKDNERAVLFPVRESDGTVISLDFNIEARQDDGTWEVVANNEAFQWMRLPMSKIQEVNYAKNGTTVRIARSTYPGASPTICFSLSSQEDVRQFIDLFPLKTVTVDSDSARLNKIFQTAKSKAAEHAAKNIKGLNGTGAESKQSSHQKLIVALPARSATSPTETVKKSEKIKDRMLRANQDLAVSLTDPADIPQPTTETTSLQTSGTGPGTRRTRRSSPSHIPIEPIERWTQKNPDWRTKWQQSLVYPATGKNRATVDDADVIRLDEGEYINDNLISFYVRYLQIQTQMTRPEILDKVYIFSSFFFEKLKKPQTKYEGVKSWTAKVDLFSYDYIVVPVNENAHWYLAIICNAPRMLKQSPKADQKSKSDGLSGNEATNSASPRMPAVEQGVKSICINEEPGSSPSNTVRRHPEANFSPSQRPSTEGYGSSTKLRQKKPAGGSIQRFDVREPKIVTLDSLAGTHSPTCRALREYLVDEAWDKKGVELERIPSGMTGRKIPEQNNFCDCGVFVLGYMKEFMKDPEEAVRRLLQKEPLDWDIRPSELRAEIRELLFTLQEEQQVRLEEERQEKKKRLRAKKAAAAAAAAVTEPLAGPAPTTPGESSSKPPLPKDLQSSSTSKQPSGTSTNPPSVAPSPNGTTAPLLEAAREMGSRADIEPKFVERLKDTGDTTSNDDHVGDTFYSAETSPANDQSEPQGDKPVKRPFVEQISSSDSDDKPITKKTKTKKKPVNLANGQRTPTKSNRSALRSLKETSTTSSYFQSKGTD